MAQNAIPKRLNLATAAVANISALLSAANKLAECAAEVTAMGADGNYQDSDFTATSNPYLSAYNIGVLFSVVIPNITTLLNGYLQGNSGATNIEIIRICLPTPPN